LASAYELNAELRARPQLGVFLSKKPMEVEGSPKVA
jgi:hypothetical protein